MSAQAEPGTYGAMNRDDYPTFATIWIPFGPKHFLMVWGVQFKDGRVAQALLTEQQWAALPEERRDQLAVDPAWCVEPTKEES